MLVGNDIVLTHAVLTFLDARGGGATLQEISRHFGVKWQKILDLLWSANMVDLPGLPEPFDLELPLPPKSATEPDDEVATAESWVSFGPHGTLDIPPLSLNLDEVMLLVAVLDHALEVTPPGEARNALTEVRLTLVNAARDRGCGGALWEAPSAQIGDAALHTLIGAIGEGAFVTMTYHRPGPDLHERVSSEHILPLSFVSGARPTLRADKGGHIRSYRLDRIGRVDGGERASRATLKAAKARAEVTDRSERLATRHGEDVWHPDGTLVRITTTRAGLWAAETLPDTQVTEEGDTLVLTLRARSLEWLLLLLIQLGNAVVAIEPRGVADTLARMAARLEEETP